MLHIWMRKCKFKYRNTLPFYILIAILHITFQIEFCYTYASITLSWSHLPIGIRHLSQHSYISSIQYYSAAFCLLRSKLPSSIPNSSFRHSQDLAWMCREFLPRTEPYRQTKLYAKYLSFTIVVLTEILLEKESSTNVFYLWNKIVYSLCAQ